MKNFKLQFISVALIFFSSCGGEPTSGNTKHIYRNSSVHTIELIVYEGGKQEGLTDFILQPEEEKVFNNFGRKGKDNPPFNNIRYIYVDSLVTIFNDTLSISYDIGRLDGNPMRISNYELIEGEKEPYIYLFEFTNEDYERALERGRIIK